MVRWNDIKSMFVVRVLFFDLFPENLRIQSWLIIPQRKIGDRWHR